MPKIHLTDTFVSTAVCPTGKGQEIYWDYPVDAAGQIRNGSVSGLGLRVTALGAKSFVHAYRFNRKRYRKALGSIIVMSVASARMAVTNRERLIEAGENPDMDETNPRRIH
jgi:hypothetical protein